MIKAYDFHDKCRALFMTIVIIWYYCKVTLWGNTMDIKDCYRNFEGDYEDALSRLMNDMLIEKFLKKFLNDDSFDKLSKALQTKDYHEAFVAAHTLKGVSLNLALGKLAKSVNEITEYLRDSENKVLDETKLSELYDTVSKDYNMTVSVIREI